MDQRKEGKEKHLQAEYEKNQAHADAKAKTSKGISALDLTGGFSHRPLHEKKV